MNWNFESTVSKKKNRSITLAAVLRHHDDHKRQLISWRMLTSCSLVIFKRVVVIRRGISQGEQRRRHWGTKGEIKGEIGYCGKPGVISNGMNGGNHFKLVTK